MSKYETTPEVDTEDEYPALVPLVKINVTVGIKVEDMVAGNADADPVLDFDFGFVDTMDRSLAVELAGMALAQAADEITADE